MTNDSNSTPFQGLSKAEADQRRAQFGPNELTAVPRDPWWRQLLGKFNDPIIRILIIADVVTLLSGEWIEGCGILLAILLATGLAFINEFKAEKAFDILNKVSDDVEYKVIRDGQFQMVLKNEITVGDVLFIELGEEIPADGQILDAVNLHIDQSRLTGESDGVPKRSPEQPPVENEASHTYPVTEVLRGTWVSEGYGYVEVTKIGDATEIGKTAREAAINTHEVTPLNRQLEKLSKAIGVFGFLIAGTTFALLVARGYALNHIVQTQTQWILSGIFLAGMLIALSRVWIPVLYDGIGLFLKREISPRFLGENNLKNWGITFGIAGALVALGLLVMGMLGYAVTDYTQWMDAQALHKFINFFMIGVTLIIVAVPEGLAMSVTLSLAYSMRKMTATNNLVRKMHACETIGATTVICTDKTGTLTLNQMRVSEGCFKNGLNETLACIIAMNSTANLSFAQGADQEPLPIGNPTEGALLLWLHQNQFNYNQLRTRHALVNQWTFSTARKMMATLVHNEEAKCDELYVKGAPEFVLKCCSQIVTEGGVETFTEELKAKEVKRLHACQGRGMRTLAFAHKKSPVKSDELADVAQELTWLGFVAISDPVRSDVPDAIQSCTDAGIQVKMVTGDTAETAKEIGRQIHLWDESTLTPYTVMTGSDFQALDEEESKVASRELRIMARARPEDKLKLVRTLKTLGEVVAVTGDGTNDAPAMNYADVGIAMGKTGTAVAKEASDIILLDDSFTSIVNAVLWGRSLYRNIQKFILFQLTVNFVALTVAVLGPVIGVDFPLTVIQMLWINLIMDTFAALALATDPPDPRLMKNKPRRSSAFIVTPEIAMGIFGTGIFFVAVLIGMLLWMNTHDLSNNLRWQTLFFTTMVMLQVWNLFNAKLFGQKTFSFGQFFNNQWFLGIVGFIVFSQFILVQFGGQFFRTTPIGITDWVIVIAATSLILPLGIFLRRFVFKPAKS